MNCPVCSDAQLQMTERQGVEIDYCPKCRGVWLDRGELDKIIDRASAEFSSAASQSQASAGVPGATAGPGLPGLAQQQQPGQQQQQGQGQQGYPPQGQPGYPPPPPPSYGNQYGRKPDDSDYKFRYPQQGGHYKKRKSILSDIFDF